MEYTGLPGYLEWVFPATPGGGTPMCMIPRGEGPNTVGETGAVADVIAVEGEPLEDISVLENIMPVMKGGQVYKSPA